MISEAVAYLEADYDEPAWLNLGLLTSTNITRPLIQEIGEMHDGEDCEVNYCPGQKYRNDWRVGREMSDAETRSWALDYYCASAHDLRAQFKRGYRDNL